MKDYDESESIDRLERMKRSREPDDEGFVLVKQRYVGYANPFYC